MKSTIEIITGHAGDRLPDDLSPEPETEQSWQTAIALFSLICIALMIFTFAAIMSAPTPIQQENSNVSSSSH